MNLLKDNEYVIGIDLGTTNTCAAIMTSCCSDPVMITQNSGSRLLRSCAQFGDHTDVGDVVYMRLTYGYAGIVKNSKRILGRYYDDAIVQRCIRDKQCAVDIIEMGSKPVFSIDDHTRVSPSDVACLIIQRIMKLAKENIKNRYGRDMDCVKVAVTFPANFNNNQRTATLLAVEKAGIPRTKLKMMNEPSAAAFYYCKLRNIDNKTILIYDLGGGTFDVSIIRVENGDYTVLKYAGDPFLGGADFDAKLAEFIEKKYETCFHAPLINTTKENIRKRFLLRLHSIAEQVKIQLSMFSSYNADLSAFTLHAASKDEDDEEDEEGQYLPISRVELEECIKGFIDNSIKIVQQCIDDCGMTKDDIDHVVLIGGSSRLTIVTDRLKAFFGEEKLKGTVNPDEAVACGACQSLVQTLNLKDRIVYSLGQRLKGGRIQCLIPRQSIIKYTSRELPTHPSEDYTTYVKCAIYQGNAEKIGSIEPQSQCDLVEEYIITGYTVTLRTNVTFLTRFIIDEWGIINVIQTCKETNKVLLDKMFRWKEPVDFISIPDEWMYFYLLKTYDTLPL